MLPSNASPLITVTDLKLLAKKLDLFLSNSISFVDTSLSSSSILLDKANPIFPPPTISPFVIQFLHAQKLSLLLESVHYQQQNIQYHFLQE